MTARRAPPAAARRLRDLRNLGEVTERWLIDVGIADVRALRRLGPLEAYRRLKTARPGEVTLVALWALAGALLDLDWRELPPDMKQQLKARLDAPARRGRRVRE